LATPLGINSTTGVAGLTLGGGFGWLSRKYGMTVDNLESVEVVTAAGEVIRASANEHPDLFWALRGGGGNFGVVTKFEFRLHPVGPEVLSGLIVYPLSKSVLQQYRDFALKMPDELVVWAVLRQAPPLPFLPEAMHGKEIVALALLYSGDPKRGEAAIEPLRHFGTPAGEHVGVQPYVAWQQALDPLLTPGARNYWKSHNFSTLDDKVLEMAVESTRNLAVAGVRDLLRSAGRRDAAAGAGSHRVPAPQRPVRDERARPLAQRRRRCGRHALGAPVLRSGDAVCERRRLRQLYDRRRSRSSAGRIRSELRSSRPGEAQVRPEQSVQRQPEHQAGLSARAASAIPPTRPSGSIRTAAASDFAACRRVGLQRPAC
jgi:hypothetical protein